MAGRFSLEAIFTARDQASRVVARIHGTMSQLQRKMATGLRDVDRVNEKVLSGLGAIANKAKVVGLVFGSMAAGAAISIGKTGAEFEQAITNVGAVSLMTRDQIAELEKKALDLGASTKFSATEVAGAMELMGKAGFTNAEILQGIEGVLSAAAAEGAGIEEVAGHVSNVLKGMGLASDQAGRVADVLTLASSRTNSSISSLGESMAQVASTARQLNVPLEDTVAAVAMLQDVGLDASVAGSAVNTMLTQLAKPTDDVAAKLKKFGVKFKDAKGNMLPFQDVLANLSKAAEKSGGNFDQVAFFADLVGLRGQKAAANLKDLFNTGKVQSLTKELQGAAGSAKKMADIRMNTFSGDLEQLGGAIDSVKIALFQTQSGPLREMVQGVTAWITANQGLIKGKFVQFLVDVKAHLPEIWTWTKRIGVGVGIFLTWTAAVKVAAIATSAWGVAMSITNGIMVVLRTAVTLSTAAYGLLRTMVLSETAATVASAIASGATTAARWALNAALTVGRLATTQITLATVANAASTVANTVVTWANQAAQWAKTAAVTAYNLVLRAGTIALGIWTAATSWDTIKSGLNAIALWARNAAQIVLNVTTGLATGLIGAYTAATTVATGATTASAGAATAANAAFAPLLITLAAVAAAYLAVKLAADQAEKYSAMTEGLGVTGTVEQMWKQGTWDPAKAVDTYQNQQAKGRSMAKGEMDPFGRMYSKEEMISRSETKHAETMELTIKDETGKAQVTKAPKGGKGVKLESSGTP